MLIEFGLVRVPHRISTLVALTTTLLMGFALFAGRVHAQVVEITPPPTESPTSELAPGTQWVYWMAIGAGVIIVLVLLALAAGYMRFAPKFFGREEKPAAVPPGMRPPSLVRQAAQIRYTPPPAAERAAPAAPAQARTATATAVAERTEAPAPAAAELQPAPAAEAQAAPAAEASEVTTAPPAGEPTGSSEAEAPPAQAEASAARAEPAAPAEPAAQAQLAPTQPAPAQPAAAPRGGGGEMDQETFDRVLKEQLDRGVDRRVAEGRARAAAVVAARKKAQG